MHNYYSSLNNTNQTNWLMIGVLCLSLVISPITGLFLSVICFREKVSLVLFILFSFYFGWFYEPQMDLLNHYNHFRALIGKSLFEAWTDPETIYIGKEPYPVLFKYIIGNISTNPHFFSACACTAYASLFVYGILGSIRDLFIQKMSLPAWIFFFGIIFTVEYFWFLGFRYWSGIFVFTAFYIRFIRTCEKKYLYLSFLCICFHFALLTLCIAVILNHILKNNFKIRYILVVLAWIVRYVEIPLTTMIARLDIMKGIVKDTSRNESIIKSVAKRMEFFRNEGNIFYQMRGELLFIGSIVVMGILWRRYGKQFTQYNPTLWGLILIIYALANFGYDSLTFYDRMYKVVLLLLYIHIFLYLMNVQKEIDLRTQLRIVIFSVAPVLYAITTIVISQRKDLWNLQLWFNNFFLSTYFF